MGTGGCVDRGPVWNLFWKVARTPEAGAYAFDLVAEAIAAARTFDPSRPIVATILGRAKIGISSVIQPEGHEGESVPLILMMHDAPNAAMKKALSQIRRLPVVKAPPVMIRVESFET